VLGVDQRQIVNVRVAEGQRERANWSRRVETEPYEAILADDGLMRAVRSAI